MSQAPSPRIVIALPPPNITGVLHMGHASTFSIQDTVCRERRMRGYEVEWAPGTDHAAIATQNVIERQLAEEGLTKEALGRAAFQTRVDAWYEEYGGRIIEQMRRMGYTCDWERLRFTLDDRYVHAIRLVFKTLFDEGLVYRGPRIVNWCPLLPLGDQRRGDRMAGADRHALLPQVSGRGWPEHHGRDGASGDDAR